MKSVVFLLGFVLLLSSCGDTDKEEIYNENNTSVSAGIVYNIEDKPIDGLYKIYYQDGTVKMEVRSKGGLPNGIGRFYSQDGSLAFQCNFVDGKLDGPFYNYYSDGHIHNEMHYMNGVKHGTQKSYDEEGNLLVEIVVEDGRPISGYTVVKGAKVEFTTEELEQMN